MKPKQPRRKISLWLFFQKISRKNCLFGKLLSFFHSVKIFVVLPRQTLYNLFYMTSSLEYPSQGVSNIQYSASEDIPSPENGRHTVWMPEPGGRISHVSYSQFFYYVPSHHTKE